MLKTMPKDIHFKEVLRKRYLEIIELYTDDSSELHVNEKIYLQGIIDGIFIGIKKGKL